MLAYLFLLELNKNITKKQRTYQIFFFPIVIISLLVNAVLCGWNNGTFYGVSSDWFWLVGEELEMQRQSSLLDWSALR